MSIFARPSANPVSGIANCRVASSNIYSTLYQEYWATTAGIIDSGQYWHSGQPHLNRKLNYMLIIMQLGEIYWYVRRRLIIRELPTTGLYSHVCFSPWRNDWRDWVYLIPAQLMRICPKSGQIFWEPEHIVLWSSDGGEIHSSAASSPCKITQHSWMREEEKQWVKNVFWWT